MQASPDSPTVLVLASGRGERFAASGGTTHKLRALLAGRPVLEHTLTAVRASGLPWHLEDAGHDGMGDSIAAAVRATAKAPGWLILPGDLPLIRPATLKQVATALQQARLSGYAIVRPRHQGQHGHPVGFGAACRTALLQLTGEAGAASVIRQFDALTLEVDDLGSIADIDTVQDLQDAEALLAQRGAAP